MALTRKFLQAMNIEEEKIEQIISAHTEVTNALKEERDSYKEKAEKLPELKKELADLKKNAGEDDKNPWKVKYEAIKEEFDTFKNDVENRQTTEKKSAALKKLLKDIGISDKRIDAVARVTNIDDLKLDEKGNFEELDRLKESLQKEWSDFITTTSTKGADVSTPPTTSKTSAKMTKEEIFKIKDATERQKAIQENHELFGR